MRMKHRSTELIQVVMDMHFGRSHRDSGNRNFGQIWYKMRQAVLVEPKHIEFREVEAPKASDLKEHQVLLNIKRIGICGSEIHSYHGCHPATFIR